MKTTLLFALLTLTFMGIFYASTKGTANSVPTTAFKVNLTDNPFAAEEVNIEIREVRIKYMDDPGEWIVLPTKAGIYNLLDIMEGKQTAIASGTIPAKTLGEIRLILGTNNSIRIRKKVYPLTVASGSENGLIVKAGKDLKKGTDELTVDFDAAKSIHQAEDGTYMLKPVLKLK
jgi:hypothetical protein